MKRLLWMLPLLFAGMTAAAQNQDMARLGTYMSNGEFVVGTAETVLAADITVRCEKIVCGPYARYAQKFLGLRAPLTDKTVYTVADAAIALMPGERYVTAGELPASTCRVESYEAQGADFARLQTDRLDMTETDLQTAARNAAAAIFSLRKHRLDLISGEAGENVFGAGLPVALERLDRLEQEYLELFLGRRVVTTETRRFRVTPAEGKLQQIVCRFSPDAGLLPANDLTGDIVLLQYEPQGMAVDEAGVRPTSSTIPYRIAALTRCSLIAAGQEQAAQVLPVFQFGRTIALQVPETAKLWTIRRGWLPCWGVFAGSGTAWWPIRCSIGGKRMD